MSKIHMLLIDPQWDFVHPGVPGYDPASPDPDPFMDMVKAPGKLMVGGAADDMTRLANAITKGCLNIDDLSVTMDSHRAIHIAHCDYWRDDQGNMPGPFTIISESDVIGKNPKWHTFHPGLQKWAEFYLGALAKKGRNPLCTWPKHCIWGSHGWQIYPCVQKAVQAWEEKKCAVTNVCFKGYNYRTEWYSAVAADVEDPEDNSTGINADFVDRFASADLFVFAGEALSHCMKFTFSDIVERLGPKFVKKCLLLTDCTSPVGVPMFVQDAKDFVAKYKAMGMQTATAAEFVAGM